MTCSSSLFKLVQAFVWKHQENTCCMYKHKDPVGHWACCMPGEGRRARTRFALRFTRVKKSSFLLKREDDRAVEKLPIKKTRRALWFWLERISRWPHCGAPPHLRSSATRSFKKRLIWVLHALLAGAVWRKRGDTRHCSKTAVRQYIQYNIMHIVLYTLNAPVIDITFSVMVLCICCGLIGNSPGKHSWRPDETDMLISLCKL